MPTTPITPTPTSRIPIRDGANVGEVAVADLGGGITESYVTVASDNGVFPGLVVPKKAAFTSFAALGAIDYYSVDYPGGYQGWVQDEDQIVTIVGDDFEQNPDYDDEHYGALYLPQDVGGLISMSLSYFTYDVATSAAVVDLRASIDFEIYDMPSFDGPYGRGVVDYPTASEGGSSNGAVSITEWMMPEPGESLYFGVLFRNNSTTVDVMLYYRLAISLLARKEA